MLVTEVHISEITVGDTVMHNRELRTVTRLSFGSDEFLGLLLFGDSYNLGHKKVKRVTIQRAMPKALI